MKLGILLMVCFVPVCLFAQTHQKYTLQKNRLFIQLPGGILDIVPLSEKAIDIKWDKDGSKEGRGFILYINSPFQLSNLLSPAKFKISTEPRWTA